MMSAVSVVDRDQDSQRPSNRLGSVWSEANKRQSLGYSPDMSRLEINRRRRKEAAAWLQQVTASSVASDTDNDFRSTLADGVILCKIANILCPDAIKIQASSALSSHQSRYENVQSFIRVMQSLDVPSDSTFSFEDLTSSEEAERPRVADCVLWLKRLWEQTESNGGLIVQAPANDLVPSLDSSRKAASQLSSRAGDTYHYVPSNPLGKQVPKASASPTLPPPASQGVALLLNHWSSVLKHNMTSGAPVSTGSMQLNPGNAEFSIDSMGPIFHSVLNSLTTEYERRLSAKDQDVTRAKDAFAQLQSQMAEVQRQLESVRNQFANQQQNQVPSTVHSAALIELQLLVEQLRHELIETQRKCAELEWQAGQAGEVTNSQVHELQQQVTGLSARLASFHDLEQRFRVTRDENRKLFNQVQDLKGAIRVFCRIRPAGRTGDPSSSCTEVGEEGELAVHDPSGNQEPRIYRFDKIFRETSTQEEVYEDTQPLIRSVLDGYNVCIFAYGQTGSGKTHTMSGTNVERPEGRGINYRALEDLFHIVEERKHEMEYSIKVQMLEIYNEQLRDLLVRPSGQNAPPKLDIMNTLASGCNVRNAEQVAVSSSALVMDLMDRGSRNRHVAQTDMNERSSRSHQVLTVVVDGLNKLSGAATHACLNLVDLAGSERVAKSKAAGDRLVETCAINSSLSALGDVMAALARKDNHIPFRNSKLTQLLADSLAGQAKVMMFMHISPESSFVSESLSTLVFGSKVSSITLGQAKRQVDNSKLFSNEEVSRCRKEAQDKEDQVLAWRRKFQEEARHREALQQEVERLKAALESSKGRFTADTSFSMESIPVQSRQHTPGTTPKLKLDIGKLGLGSSSNNTPIATPTTSKLGTGGGTPLSSYNMYSGSSTQRGQRPTQLPHQLLKTSSANGSQTARYAEPAPASKLPMVSARQGSTFASKPVAVAAPPMSMRTSGTYGTSLSSNQGPGLIPRQSSLRASGAAIPTIPASAGGRRSSMGQWKS